MFAYDDDEMSEEWNVCKSCFEDAEEDDETTMLVALDII
jgi:hypothetical protein